MSVIPQKVIENQRRAADPQSNVWVTANAGAGKTHVLVNRLARLMLDGADPARILCLTFTRAAAAEMQRRLFDRLAGWIALDDVKLAEALRELTGHATLRADDLARARELFARALDAPGGLKIETIHAFCERLLQRFPVEAGVVPGFEVFEDREAAELLARLKARVLAEAAEGEEARALETIIGLVPAEDLDKALTECLRHRAAIARLGTGEALWQAVSDELGLSATQHLADFAAVLRASLGASDLESAYSALLTGGIEDRKTADRIAVLSAASRASDDDAFLAALDDLYLTKKCEPRETMARQSVARAFPHIADYLIRERDRIHAACKHRFTLRLREASVALLTLARAIIARYEAEKRRLGRYDYDDLILRTRDLLSDSASAQWVLFKLDSRLEHILVDEAQDTSPGQWGVITALTEEFFSGSGAHQGRPRTLFVVGDDKQSIYSFQGADPAYFDDMQRHFRGKIKAAGLPFELIGLGLSFRSTGAVLKAVDAVLARSETMRAEHAPHRADVPGLVEIWPLIEAEAAEKRDPWAPPADESQRIHARVLLARRIAGTIRRWIDGREMLASRGRPIRCDDILILLRNRTTLMDTIVRALKQENLPVAGADRLALTGNLAVMDLMALTRCMLRPEDDLSCAALLKSPLLTRDNGHPFTDDDLITLAASRGPRTLWQMLAAHGAPYVQAATRLARWQAEAASLSPFDFFSRVLARDGGYTSLMARLGGEAAEPVDAFLAEALSYGRENTPSLQGFLAWLTAVDVTIKRDMDQGSGEIRVMTAHGAKGLEANIVILPDTVGAPDVKDTILCAPSGLPLWRVGEGKQAAAAEQLRQRDVAKAAEEYDRLLYVAMTRACDRLYVAGIAGKNELKPGTWYDRIRKGLDGMLTSVVTEDGGTVERFVVDGEAVTPDKQAGETVKVTPEPPPAWALNPPAATPEPRLWRAPSHLGATSEPDEAVWPADPASGRRYRRGNLIHSLLQYLPDLEPHMREPACRRWLAASLREDAAEADDITREVMALLAAEGFAAVFGPGSRAEVPLAALIGDSGITGRIDRLLITDEEILALDYKTNRPPPERAEDVPEPHRRQLGAYRAALSAIFPGRRIRTGLIWTHGARFMEITTPSA